jgi:hypothetical protein
MSRDRNFFTSPSNEGPYRYNPTRAIPPRILAAPRFHAMLCSKIPIPDESKYGFRECLKKLGDLYPIVNSGAMEGGYLLDGGFWIHTIWSDNPRVADVIIVKARSDTGYFGLPYQFAQTRDEYLLADLILIELPYLSVTVLA